MSLGHDSDVTYVSEAEKNPICGRRKKKVFKARINKKKLRSKTVNCGVKDAITNQAHVCEDAISGGLELQMYKLQIKNEDKKTKSKNVQISLEDDTDPIGNFIEEFVEYLNMVKTEKLDCKERVWSKQNNDEREGDGGVKILSAEITEEDQLVSSVALSQSQDFLQTFTDCRFVR